MNLGKLIFWGVLVFSLLEISAFNHLTDNSKVTHRYQFDYMLPYNESQIFWNHQDLRGDYHNELYGWKIGDRTPLMPLVAQPFYKIFGDSFTTWEIYSLLCCSLLIFAVTLYSGSYWMGIIFALSTFFFYMSKQYPFRIEMTALYFMALYFAFKKNYWLSGLFCGLSYLCHPNILPWVVGLIGYTFLTNKKNDTLKLISLFAICFLVWMGFCKFYLHQNSVFYLYPFCTENWYEALAIPPKEILNHFLNVLTTKPIQNRLSTIGLFLNPFRTEGEFRSIFAVGIILLPFSIYQAWKSWDKKILWLILIPALLQLLITGWEAEEIGIYISTSIFLLMLYGIEFFIDRPQWFRYLIPALICENLIMIWGVYQ